MLITLEDIAKEMEKSDQQLAAIQAKLARLAEIDREIEHQFERIKALFFELCRTK